MGVHLNLVKIYYVLKPKEEEKYNFNWKKIFFLDALVLLLPLTPLYLQIYK